MEALPGPARPGRPRRWLWFLLGGLAGSFLTAGLLASIGLLVLVSRAGVGGPARPWGEKVLEGSGRDAVALIQVSGEIVPGEGGVGLLGGEATGSAAIVSQIRQAMEDPRVKAILLRLETPGGAVVASDEIYRAVREARERKPVVASLGDEAASGGYYVASGATRVLANPATLTGSIGVIAVFFNAAGLASKLGIEPIIIKSGPLKDVGSPFKDMTPEERALIQNLIRQAYDQFVKAVAEGRGIPEEKVRALADGRPYSGEEARALGLVDGFGDQETAFRLAMSLAGLKEARLIRYTRPGLLPSLLGGDVLGRINPSARIPGLNPRPGLYYLHLQG